MKIFVGYMEVTILLDAQWVDEDKALLRKKTYNCFLQTYMNTSRYSYHFNTQEEMLPPGALSCPDMSCTVMTNYRI